MRKFKIVSHAEGTIFIEAADFYVEDGCLVFHDKDNGIVYARAPKSWVTVEEVTSDAKST